MTRHNMIERIGSIYLTTNIEGGEYSYIQEAGSRLALEKAVGHSVTHFKLDLRFEKEDIVVLVETKQNFKSADESQLAEYLEEEISLHSDKKIICILANTNNEKIKVWKGQINDDCLLSEETVLDTIEHYSKLYDINKQNDREKVLKNTYDLNELLHKMDIKEDLRSQFVGTTLLYIKDVIKKSGESVVENALREEHIQHNKDFQTLQSFYYKTEKEIVEAIIGIRNRLETSNEIPLTTFGELANYLIAVKYCISCNDEINDCKKLMIEKLKATETDVSLHIQHHSGIELWDDKQKAEYAEFTNLALKANKEHKKRLLIFDYTIESLSDFCSSLYNYQTISSYNEELCVSLDAEKMINLLKQCNALQISKVRGLFRELYKNLGSDNDKNEIIALRDMIQSELSNYKNYDGIQKLQIYWIINDFNRLLNNLDKKQN